MLSSKTHPGHKATPLHPSSRLPLAAQQAAIARSPNAFPSPRSNRPPGKDLSLLSTSGAIPNASLEADRLPQLRILVVDDDSPVRNACSEIAKGLGYATQSAESVQAARLALANNSVDILLLDLKLPGGGGLALLEDLRAQHPQTIVVIMTAFASVDSAVESMRIGAGDYLTKPFTLEELATTLDRAAQRRAYDVDARLLRERLRASTGLGNLIGNSPAMEKLYRILSKVASTVHPVLIIGESGTGKELVAQSIHTNGPNSSRPFIPVDCGSLLPSMIESELFGHVKGGVNGAARAKTGLLSSAEGATIYLDEIAELPLDLQNRLLRALQEKQVRPIGATQPVPLTARVLASSTRDLPALVESGRFRKDLYFRLNVVNLRIPPLRERKDDIPLLAAHILERLRNEDALPYTFADDAISLLMDYHWPGNVRELEHSIECACALSSGPVLHLGDFPTQMQDFQFHTQQSLQHEASSQATSDGLRNPTASADIGVVHSIADLEKQAILSTIAHLNGDKLTAARLLGIGKTTLYRKLKEYGINDDGSLA